MSLNKFTGKVLSWLVAILVVFNLSTLKVGASESGEEGASKGYYEELVENVTTDNVNGYEIEDVERAVEYLKFKETLTEEERESLGVLTDYEEGYDKAHSIMGMGLVLSLAMGYCLYLNIVYGDSKDKGVKFSTVVYSILLIVGLFGVIYGMFYPQIYGML